MKTTALAIITLLFLACNQQTPSGDTGKNAETQTVEAEDVEANEPVITDTERVGNVVITPTSLEKEKEQSSKNEIQDSIEVNTFSNPDGTFGYDVSMKGKKYVHQPNIPSLAGTRGFASEDDARTAGLFVVSKIRNNVLPPTVSKKELDSLGVIN